MFIFPFKWINSLIKFALYKLKIINIFPFLNLSQMTLGLYLATGYFATSLFFFCFPQILHKRKKYNCKELNEAVEGKRILRICHRGAPRYTT